MTIDGSTILAPLTYVQKLERVRDLFIESRSAWIGHVLAPQIQKALDACEKKEVTLAELKQLVDKIDELGCG